MPLPMYQESEQKKSTGLSQVKHVLAVAAGKGGVGKSLVAVNLALALQKQGFRVGIMDTDVYGPSVRKMLPEDRMPVQREEEIEPALCQGISMLSMAYFRKEQEAAVVRAPIANAVISQFVHQVRWGALDYLILDFPPGTGDIQLTLSQQISLSGALLVTTPQQLAVMDVYKAMNLFDQVRVPVLGVVENMSFFEHPSSGEKLWFFGKGGGERLARERGVPFLGQIPLDPLLCECSDQGKSILDEHPDSVAAQALLTLAQSVVDHVQLFEEKAETLSSLDLVWEENRPIKKIVEHQEGERKEALALAQSVEQEDAHTLSITWTDGTKNFYRLSDLQKRCPCASCCDERTGQRLVDPSIIRDDLTAKRVVSVGNYALRIHFASGCSNGIYSFSFLRQRWNA